ncbi:MAG TPA: DsrE family protein [Sphingomonas sp.]|nr:DsrE family protein [Sphingomonas sp.]
MSLRGLTVVVAEPHRLRVALELAAAQAALGERARVFCQGEAVAALAPPMRAAHDADFIAAGLPTLAALFEEALGLGVELIACQSGLTLMGVEADTLDPRIGYGGLVSLMQALGQDRLVVA